MHQKTTKPSPTLRKPIEQNKNEIFSLFMFYIQHMLLPDEEKVIGVFLNDLAIVILTPR